MAREEIESVKKIIKYNPYREYVGAWSPKKIQLKFREIYDNPFRPLYYVHIGGLSTDMVCDAVWNEMSYNPLRFGLNNPFTTNDIASIKAFCAQYRKIENKTDTMSKIATELWFFLHFIKKSNPEFVLNEKINGESILIRCNGSKKPNDGYKALACLVHTIHLIASQNLQDYKIKKFREQINDVTLSRHPDLERPYYYFNFIRNKRLSERKNSLLIQINQKIEDISDINIRIQTLNEYDPPVDITKEQILLSQQQSQLQRLEERYAVVNQQYNRMIAMQNTKQM